MLGTYPARGTMEVDGVGSSELGITPFCRGFFNVSWFNPADYAPHVSEVNMSKLLTCAAPRLQATPWLVGSAKLKKCKQEVSEFSATHVGDSMRLDVLVFCSEVV